MIFDIIIFVLWTIEVQLLGVLFWGSGLMNRMFEKARIK